MTQQWLLLKNLCTCVAPQSFIVHGVHVGCWVWCSVFAVSVPGDRIAQFLRENSSGRLWVTVGFASAFGLAWLDERTVERPVNLLIGDIRTGFSKSSEADRLAAIRFVQRRDVSISNWYSKRGGYQTAHAKAWIVEPDPLNANSAAVLVGSANLTKQGLLNNFEMMTLADPEEHERLQAEMRQVMNKSWPIEDKLLKRLGHYEPERSTGTVTTPASLPQQSYRHPSPTPSAHKSRPRHRPSRRISARSRRDELVKALVMLAAGLVLLALLPSLLNQCGSVS